MTATTGPTLQMDADILVLQASYTNPTHAEAIRLVIEQMESMAPRYAEGMNP